MDAQPADQYFDEQTHSEIVNNKLRRVSSITSIERTLIKKDSQTHITVTGKKIKRVIKRFKVIKRTISSPALGLSND